MDRPTGEVTFGFTDIEGSTALLNDLGSERYARVLAEHFEIIRRAFEDRRGIEVGTEGDGTFYVWEHALDGLEGAAAAQRGLAAYDWPFGVSVRVRIGLHTGEGMAREDGDYIGLGVHQAARIMTAANGGQILVSPQAAAAVGNADLGAFSLEPVGEFHVRDFPVPVLLHRVAGDGLPAVDTPPRAPRSEPRNFAALATSFVGRDQEVVALRDLVATNSLVTVVGPGGVGKTRLAREVGRLSTGGFNDGVWLVELEGLDAPSTGAVAAAVATAIQVPIAAGTSPVDAVVDDLVDHTRLVLLDSCEAALDAVAAIVEAVGARQGKSQFLATSREALALRSERRWPLAPLTPPDDDPDFRTIAANPASQLFADRARAVNPSFAIDETTAPEVAAVCRTLEGIPLALELAAARLSELDMEELALSVQRVLELRGGYRTDPARHRTMRALVAWSAESLSESQRAVYTRLAPLRGWSTRAAAVVAGGAGKVAIGEGEADLAVAALIDKSILLTDEAGRVRMLDPVREHAAEELTASGDEDAVMSELLAWVFERRCDGAVAPQLAGEESPRSSDLSSDAIRALLNWARDADPVAMAQLVTTMQADFVLGARSDEGLEWVDAALVLVGDEHPALRAALIHVGGSIAQSFGDAKRSRDMAERGIAAAEAALEAQRLGKSVGAQTGIGLSTSLVGAANTLGASLLYERRLDEAEKMFDRAASLVEPDSRVMIVIRNNQASLHLARGDLAATEASLREAARIATGSGDPNAPHIMLNLAAVRGISGDHAGAAAELEAGIEQAKAMGALQLLPMAVTNLGIARRNLGDSRALETLRDGIRMARDQQNLMALAEGMRMLADVARHEPTELRAAAEDLGAVASRIPDNATGAWAAALIAVAEDGLGDASAARAARRQCVAMARSGELPPTDAATVLLELANSFASTAPETAARLLGAAEGAVPPALAAQPGFVRIQDAVRTRVDETLGDGADLLVAEGRGLTVEAALDLASP